MPLHFLCSLSAPRQMEGGDSVRVTVWRLLSGAGNVSLRERRNYAMLEVLTGCGLRRAKAAALKVEDL